MIWTLLCWILPVCLPYFFFSYCRNSTRCDTRPIAREVALTDWTVSASQQLPPLLKRSESWAASNWELRGAVVRFTSSTHGRNESWDQRQTNGVCYFSIKGRALTLLFLCLTLLNWRLTTFKCIIFIVCGQHRSVELLPLTAKVAGSKPGRELF